MERRGSARQDTVVDDPSKKWQHGAVTLARGRRHVAHHWWRETGSPLGSPVGTAYSVRVGLGAWRAGLAIRVIAQHTPVARLCLELLS